jgi:hypothetical protein
MVGSIPTWRSNFKMRICYNFLVCEKHHSSRTIPLVETVCKDIINSGDEYFLLGGFENKIDSVKITKTSNSDDFKSCPQKLLKSFEYHYDNDTKFDWYFIGDDDTYVCVDKLNKLVYALENFHLKQNEPVVVCYLKKNGDYDAGIYGGGGILINRKTFLSLCKFLFKTNFRITSILHGDRALFNNIEQYNCQVEPKDRIRFISINEMLPICNVPIETYDNNITVHLNYYLKDLNLRIPTMYEIHEIFKNSKKDFKYGFFDYFHPTINNENI